MRGRSAFSSLETDGWPDEHRDERQRWETTRIGDVECVWSGDVAADWQANAVRRGRVQLIAGIIFTIHGLICGLVARVVYGRMDHVRKDSHAAGCVRMGPSIARDEQQLAAHDQTRLPAYHCVRATSFARYSVVRIYTSLLASRPAGQPASPLSTKRRAR
jgi:hypothetical protein